jgi:hypothetical protein
MAQAAPEAGLKFAIKIVADCADMLVRRAVKQG